MTSSVVAGDEVGKPAPSAVHVSHVHNFRGLAIVFIVVTHVLSVFDWSSEPYLKRVLKYALANGTIFFLFISGYLFEHLSARFEVFSYWKQKLKFVVLPYVLVSVPALVLFIWVMPRPEVRDGFYDQPKFMQLLEFLVTGTHLAPFWFIPTIACFYVIAPLIKKSLHSDAGFLALPFLFLIPLGIDRSSNPALNMVHFLPIWVMGMAACRFRSQSEGQVLHFWPLFLILAVALGVLEFETTRGTHTYLGYLQKAALIAALFGLLLRAGNRADRWFGWAGTLSFGIFFLHSYVISGSKVIIQRVLGDAPDGSITGVLVAAFLATVLTAALVELVRRSLKGRSRLIIGV